MNINAAQALLNTRVNDYRNWNRSPSSAERSRDAQEASNRIFDGFAHLNAEPPLRPYSLVTPVFAMGSCFAREIEAELIKRGGNVVSVDDGVRIGAFARISGKGEAGYFHRFTPQAMLLEFQRAFGEAPGWEEDTLVFPMGNDYIDLNYFQTDDFSDKGREAALTRRAVATRLVRNAALADIVIVTLGLTESFVHKPTGWHANRVPSGYLVRHKEEFAFHIASVEETLVALEEIRALIGRHRSTPFELVVTVSPVPLGTTFSNKDVIVANMDSKSTLRAAAAHFSGGHADVHYFPSYEMVVYTDPQLAWRPDRMHVQGQMVARIVDTFVRTCMPVAETAVAPGGAPVPP